MEPSDMQFYEARRLVRWLSGIRDHRSRITLARLWRSASRDVSFCQFVVRDGKAFEVSHAGTDDRVPQHLVKEYGTQSYLGVPIHARDVVAARSASSIADAHRSSASVAQKLAVLSIMPVETTLAKVRITKVMATREPS